MRIHHLRNATFVLEHGDRFILVDPMLGEKGTLNSFTFIRYKMQKNPIVPLPKSSTQILEKVTDCLITHLHPDHLDKAGETFLKEKNIEVVCCSTHEKELLGRGLKIRNSMNYWEKREFYGGKITGIPARHGYGWIAKPMGKVLGFNIEFADGMSAYISADTVLTEEVKSALRDFKPDLAVVAAGTARLDFGKPLLMTLEDIIQFVKLAPAKVLANHMEALNHCPTTRKQLKAALDQHGLREKVMIPDDGESMDL